MNNFCFHEMNEDFGIVFFRRSRVCTECSTGSGAVVGGPESALNVQLVQVLWQEVQSLRTRMMNALILELWQGVQSLQYKNDHELLTSGAVARGPESAYKNDERVNS